MIRNKGGLGDDRIQTVCLIDVKNEGLELMNWIGTRLVTDRTRV